MAIKIEKCPYCGGNDLHEMPTGRQMCLSPTCVDYVNPFEVYLVTCSLEPSDVYVGVTQTGVDHRFSMHKRGSQLGAWIFQMRCRGANPRIHVVEVAKTRADVFEAENYWIELMRFFGMRVLNRERNPRQFADPRPHGSRR